jgi:hypothetical protein
LKTIKPVLKNQGHSSSMQTPDYALDPLVPFLKHKEWMYWDCACGKGNIVRGMINRGFKCVGSDINIGEDYLDIFNSNCFMSENHIICTVTNPPYNIKDKFLERAFDLEMPFAFLLPIESLGGAKRQAMYRKYGLEVILFPFRVNFETPNNGSSAWFPVAWFCHGLNIGRDLTFVEDTRCQKD